MEANKPFLLLYRFSEVKVLVYANVKVLDSILTLHNEYVYCACFNSCSYNKIPLNL